MAIIGSTDNGDGSYTFQLDTGQELTSFGPAAAMKHDELQSSSPDVETAQLNPTIAAAAQAPRPDMRTAMMGPIPSAVQSDVAAQVPGVALPRDASEAAAAGENVYGTPAERAAGAAAPGARRGTTTVAPAHIDPSRLNFRQPGGAAPTGPYVGPTKAAWVPHSRTEEQGLQETPRMKELHEGAQTSAENAAAAQASLAANQVNFAADEAARRQAILERQQAEDEKRNQEQRAKIDANLANYQKLSTDFNNGKIDPDQWMNQQGIGGRISLGIAAALGAIGQGYAGIPNQTMDFIKSKIDNNIKAQTANRDSLKTAMDASHNQLSDIEKIGMGQEEFVARQRALGWKAAEAEMEKRRKDLGIQEADVNYQKTLAAIQAEGAKAEEHYQQLVQNKVQTSSIFHPATAGGPAAPSKKAEEDAAKYGKSLEDAKLNEADATIENVDRTLKQYQGKEEIPGVGPENVLTRGVKGAANFVGGEGTGEKLVYNAEERGNRQTVAALKADLKHAISGAAVSPSEKADLDSMIEGAKTPSDLQNTVNIIRRKAQAHKDFLAGGVSPEGVALYNARRAAQRQQNSTPAIPSLKPYGGQ